MEETGIKSRLTSLKNLAAAAYSIVCSINVSAAPAKARARGKLLPGLLSWHENSWAIHPSRNSAVVKKNLAHKGIEIESL